MVFLSFTWVIRKSCQEINHRKQHSQKRVILKWVLFVRWVSKRAVNNTILTFHKNLVILFCGETCCLQLMFVAFLVSSFKHFIIMVVPKQFILVAPGHLLSMFTVELQALLLALVEGKNTTLHFADNSEHFVHIHYIFLYISLNYIYLCKLI